MTLFDLLKRYEILCHQRGHMELTHFSYWTRSGAEKKRKGLKFENPACEFEVRKVY